MNFADLARKYFAKKGSQPFNGCTFSNKTAIIAAGLASGGAVYALRYPAAATKRWALQWMHLHYACITAFTTPVTATRHLHLTRGSGADATGGNTVTPVRNDSAFTTETLPTGQIASTGVLTVTGVTLEGAPSKHLLLAHAGASGQDYDELWTFDDPLILNPGQLVAITAGAAFDAGGTWTLEVKGGGVELP